MGRRDFRLYGRHRDPRQRARRLSGGPDAASVARSWAFARDWQNGPARRTIAAAFVGAADPDRLAERAAALLSDAAWLEDYLAPLCTALAADPWFEPPLRVSSDRSRSGAILYEDAQVAVTASVLSCAAMRDTSGAATLVASGRLGVTRYVRGGGATLLRWAVPPVPPVCTQAVMGEATMLPALRPTDGLVVRHDGRLGAQQIVEPAADVATVTVTIRAGADPVAREYDRTSGAFLRMATNDEGAARGQLLLSLLRASGAADAGAAFDAATRDGAFFLRWSAMREWLAHDWRGGWHRLQDMADTDPHPEVRAAAAATLAALTRRAA